MSRLGAFLDQWLRAIGALVIVLVGFATITFSFYANEINREDLNRQKFPRKQLIYATSSVENWFYDLRTARFFDHHRMSPDLTILDITDETLSKVGRWPWTRTVHARILDNLREYGAKVVMFDVVFPEKESDLADQAMVDAIQRFTSVAGNSVVLGYGQADDSSSALKEIPAALQVSMISGTTATKPIQEARPADKYNFAYPLLAESNAYFGFISNAEDLDGIYRHSALVTEVEKTYYPSLALSGFQAYFSNGENKKILVEPDPSTADYFLKIQNEKEIRAVRLNPRGEFKVRFFGGPRNFQNIPAHEVALDSSPSQNQKLKEVFAGKAVLIGSSAFGAHDLRHTPVDSKMPGMYMHANIFHALDQGHLFQEGYPALFISLGLYLLGILAVLVLFRVQEPLVESIGSAVVLGGIYAVDYFDFAPRGYFIRLFACLAGPAALHAWFTILNVFKEAREKKKIRATFTRYVSPKIVKEMLSNPEKLRVGGEKKDITMLFSDVRDFTSISERLGAQDLATLLNIYMGKMTDILFATDGTLDKYIGDALVGFWGAPLDVPDHAYHGVKGASLMLEALPEINAEFKRKGYPEINVGIGLNSGEVSVGNMGSDQIFQYTALGDAMNLASRIESLTKYYGVNLMISEFTHAKLGEHQSEFLLRPLDLVQVKGKSEAVKIYEVVPSWSPWAKNADALAQFTTAYESLYLGKKFSAAVAAFDEILQQVPGDKTTLKLRESAIGFTQSPPPDSWTGVTVFTTK